MEQEETGKVVSMVEEPTPKKAKVAEFDRNTNYQWQPDEVFDLKGGELHTLKQILVALISPAEAQRAIAAYEALKLIDGIIREGVELGKIVPAPQSEPEDTKD